ncbi:hypothetical protein BGZ65_008702 [Modicella reniformis]|uniref:Uncharacterized protein n=1 Tax=Modicella reniformis TaxID=1440133 RepID=A0A9P6M874_9FUNG|nr:hypothetical protein BGZ65_008702 [Modicella reniformis]
MHSNNTQVHVQIPAAYYSLGSVAMNGNMGFEHSSSSNNGNTPLNTYHTGNQFHNSSQHHHTTSPQLGYHGHQQQPHNGSSQHSHNGSNHVHHPDLQKTISLQHQVDIYQPPHQTLDSDLMNPIVNRQLNNQYASNYHSPYNYHYSNQHTHYGKQQQYQQQVEQQSQSSEQQMRSNASTPTPTLTSALSTVSSASTPSLSSNTTLPNGHEYYNRQSSPSVTSTTPSSALHVPTSPDSLVMGSHPSPLASGMAQPMSTWTNSNGKVSRVSG